MSGLACACSLDPQSAVERNGALFKEGTPSHQESRSFKQVKSGPLATSYRNENHSAYNKQDSSQSRSASKVEVERLSVARDVKQRRIIGVGDHFPNTIGAVWSLAEVYAHHDTAELEMRWWRGKQIVSVSPFLVSEGLRWREWSKLNIKPSESGEWRVEVYQPSTDRILMTKAFSIQASSEISLASASDKAEATDHIDPLTSKQRYNDLESSSTKVNTSTTDERRPLDPPLIQTLKIARQVKRRRPIDAGSRFTLDNERLWGYIEAFNLKTPNHVWMEWYHGDTLRSKLRVRVGHSRRWRTWSWQRLGKRDHGQWTVKVLSRDGELLKETHFIVVK